MFEKEKAVSSKLVYFHKQACFHALISGVFPPKSSEGSLWIALSAAEGCTVALSKPTYNIKNKNSFCFLFQDKALIETTDQITEVTSKFKTLEGALRAAKLEEFSRNREHQDLKLTLNDVVFQVNKMKGKCLYWAPNLV